MTRSKKQILKELAELRPYLHPETTVEDLISQAQEREENMDKLPDRVQTGAIVDRPLWTEVKIKAIREGKSTGEILEEALREYMGMEAPEQEAKPAPPKEAKPAPDQGTDQAEVEKFILDRPGQKGRDLAQELNDAGYRTLRGKLFSEGRVNKIRWQIKNREGQT